MFKKFGYAAAFMAVAALGACKKAEESPETEVVASEPADAPDIEMPAEETSSDSAK